MDQDQGIIRVPEVQNLLAFCQMVFHITKAAVGVVVQTPALFKWPIPQQHMNRPIR